MRPIPDIPSSNKITFILVQLKSLNFVFFIGERKKYEYAISDALFYLLFERKLTSSR